MRTMPNTICIIGSQNDGHIPFVARHLDCPYIILDAVEGALAGKVGYSYDNTRKVFDFIQNGKAVKNITGVWYRRTILQKPMELPVPMHLHHYSSTALQTMEHFLWTRFSNAVWVSDPFVMTRSNDKLLQLEIAARLGFNVPETIVTASESAAKTFVARRGQAVTKAVGARYFKDQSGRHRVFYTRKIDAASDFTGLQLAPAFFQQAIDPAEDIRVTVVGRQVFAATIKGSMVDSPNSDIRDWRLANFDKNMDIRVFELPTKISRLCVKLVEELGLKFGTVDLILDKKGKFWFLENNPDGQWAFVEEVTGQPIGKAVARLLTTSK